MVLIWLWQTGTELRSAMDGVVEKVVDLGSNNLGKGVFIRNEDGTLSIYGHMSSIKVKVGEHLHSGDSLGLSGKHRPLYSCTSSLWYERRCRSWVDPTPVAEQVSNMQGSGFQV
jgi:septal ring factor EnvC (AmiA/AmiB activator)